MSRFLTSLAEAEIQQLVEEGITLAPEEIVELNELAKRVETPEARLALSRGKPVAVGGVYLWPFTLAGASWYREHMKEFGGLKHQRFALAYVMAHGRDPLPEDMKEAHRLINQWSRKLTCRPSELEEAIRQIIEQDELPDTEEKGPVPGVGEISMMMTALTSVRPEVWEYQCSMNYVLRLLDRLTGQNAAEGQSNRSDPRIKAERVLGLAVNRIRKKWKKQHNG